MLKRLLMILSWGLLTGCSHHYVLTSNYVASEQEQRPPEVTDTSDYQSLAAQVKIIAVRAPDDCSNKTLNQATGSASSKETILKTNCGVEMAEIERSLSRNGYRVISWNVLTQKLAATSVSPVEAASVEGADVLLQINSLEKAEKLLGKDARWERKYLPSNPAGDPIGEQKFNDKQRSYLKETFLGPYEKQYRPEAPSVTLDATAVSAKTGQAIWYYRWTHSAKRSEEHSKNRVVIRCDDTDLKGCRTVISPASPAVATTTEASGDSEAISLAEKPNDRQAAVYDELLKVVIDNMVKSFANTRGSSPTAVQ